MCPAGHRHCHDACAGELRAGYGSTDYTLAIATDYTLAIATTALPIATTADHPRARAMYSHVSSHQQLRRMHAYAAPASNPCA